MKKLILLLAILICTAMLIACSPKSEIPFDETQAFFVAKVLEVNENTLLAEVTQTGNSSLTVGTPAYVSTDFEGYTECSVGDYIRVEFDSMVQEIYPPRIPNVFSIDKTDDAGKIIE